MENKTDDIKEESITYGGKKSQSLLDKIIFNLPDTHFIKLENFDAGVIGVDAQSERLIYSTKKVLAILVEQGMTNEEALDYFYGNIECTGLGPEGPIYCFDLFE